MNIEEFMAAWAVIGMVVCVILPRIEWKTRLRRFLYIFLCGPFVWFIAIIVYYEERFLGIKETRSVMNIKNTKQKTLSKKDEKIN